MPSAMKRYLCGIAILASMAIAGCGAEPSREFPGERASSTLRVGERITPGPDSARTCTSGKATNGPTSRVDEAVTVDLALAVLIELDSFSRRVKSALLGVPKNPVWTNGGCQ